MKPAFINSGRPLLRLLIASSIIAAFPAQANDQQEINRLKALIEELDQRVRILDRKQEIATDEAAAKQKSAPIVTASDKGFGIKSADGDFEYRLRGLAHLDYRRFEGDSSASTIYDGFLFRRIRPTFEGTIFKNYGFRFTPEFAEAVMDRVPQVSLRTGSELSMLFLILDTIPRLLCVSVNLSLSLV